MLKQKQKNQSNTLRLKPVKCLVDNPTAGTWQTWLQASGSQAVKSEHRSTHQEQHILCILRWSDLKQTVDRQLVLRWSLQNSEFKVPISARSSHRNPADALLGRLYLAVQTQSHRQHETLGEVGHIF